MNEQVNPSFTSSETITNRVKDIVLADISDDFRLFFGTSGSSIYTWDYSDGKTARRKNYISDVTTEIILDFSTNKREMLAYVPVTEDVGIMIVDEYSGGTPTGNIEIYDMDWSAKTYTYRNGYAYSYSGNYYTDALNIIGGTKYDGKTRYVIGFYVEIGVKHYTDFLIYDEDADTFTLVNSPRGVNDDNFFWGNYYYPRYYADLGNGTMAIALDTYENVATPTNLGSAYMIFLDTIAKTSIAVALPRSVNNPVQNGDYAYDINKYCSMAPWFSDNSVYIQTEYVLRSAGVWGSTTRILKITSGGIITVVKEFAITNEELIGYLLMYSKNRIISCHTDNYYFIFYDVTYGNDLFQLPMFEYTQFSTILNDTDDAIIMVADWIWQTLKKDGIPYAYTDVSRTVKRVSLAGVSQPLIDLDTIPDYPPGWAIDTEQVRLIGDWIIYPTDGEEWYTGGAPHIILHHTTIATGDLFQATTWH